MQTEDDEWFDKVEKLSASFDGDGPDERFRQIARQEAIKLIDANLGPIIFAAALYLAFRDYGQRGIFVMLAVAGIWLVWKIIRVDFDPQQERHLIVGQAEDLNRLTVVAEAHEAGEKIWLIEGKQYERDTKKVVVFDGSRWDGSWKRIHAWACEFERISPRKRRKRLLRAAVRARAALEQGEALAKEEDAELAHWARIFLQK